MPNLKEIKEEYIKAFVKGDFPTLEELIARYPEHAEELTDFCLHLWPFANHMKAQLIETLLWYVDDREI